MFGIGPTELIVIAVVALVVFGPQRLPELMRQLGRFVVHAKRVSSDIREVVDDTIKQAEREIALEEQKKSLQESLAISTSQASAKPDSEAATRQGASAHKSSPSQIGENSKEPIEETHSNEMPSESLSTNVCLDRSDKQTVDWDKDEAFYLASKEVSPTTESSEDRKGSSHVPVG